MTKLQAQLASLRIPENEWPVRLRNTTDHHRKTDVVLRAFEEMERALKARHAERLDGQVECSYIFVLRVSRARLNMSINQTAG
jgi:hypothetical protein